MSFVSVLPFGDTFEHWWFKLAGEPGRLRFMAVKVLEATAFVGAGPVLPHLPKANALHPVAQRKQSENTVPADPMVVVVVPVYCRTADDARRVGALVASLAGQSRPCRTVLVDDGSPSWTVPAGVELLQLGENAGPAAARNRGLERALELGADIVAFTDSDCVPGEDWVRSIVAAFQSDRGAHAISGATWSLDDAYLGRYHERNGTLNGRALTEGEGLLYGPTCNFAVCAELARALRFDEAFRTAAAEDIDYCYRARHDGWTVRHAESVVVRHDYGYDDLGTAGGLLRFWRQFRRYARGARLLLEKHPGYVEAFARSSEISLQGEPADGRASADSAVQRTEPGSESTAASKPELSSRDRERLRKKLDRLENEDPNVYPLF